MIDTPSDNINNIGSNNNSSDITSIPSASTSISTSSPTPTPPSTSTSTSDMSSTKKKTTRRKFACVECRQQKSKCDAMEKAPDPCTKCFKKNIPCVLKRDFKRTYKRIRNEVIEKSFKHLTQYLSNTQFNNIDNNNNNSNSNNHNNSSINNSINNNNTVYIKSLWDNNNFTKDKIKNKSDYWKDFINSSTTIQKQIQQKEINNNNSSSNSTNNASSSQLNFPLTLTEEDLKCTPKSLGDIYLTSNDISTLFNEFALHYHPFLPIVNMKRGPESIYNLSPCLFWVIMLTGLRRCDSILNKYKNINILKQLSHLVKSVLAEITISPIIRYIPNENDQPLLNVASVYSVQAFLIYTLWPPLTSSLSADTSWNTIGTAMFQALRVGLNSADFSKEYVTTNWDLINEQRKTWVCCNIVSQFIASSMGFPPYVSFDHSVLTHQNNSNIPVLLQQMIQLSYFENQIIQTMNSNPLTPSGMIDLHERFSLLQVLNQQLSQLESQLNQPHQKLDDIRKFLLYVAKVHLLTYYFTVSTKGHSSSDDTCPSTTANMMNVKNNNTSTFQIKSGLVKVYNSAINLLFHTRDMFLKDPDSIKYFPGCFILNIWQSACIITKLIHSSISDIIDCKRGEEAYDVAIQLTLRASILKYDMAYRSSGIMRSIWSLFSNMYNEWQNDRKNAEKQSDSEFNLNITVSSRMSVSVFFDCLYILKTKCGMAKLKRESGKLQQDEGEEEDDNIENIGDDLLNVSKSTIRKNVKDLKVSARKIIKSVPLDPNPINADNSSATSITSNITSNTAVVDTTTVAAKNSNNNNNDSNNNNNNNNVASTIRSGSNLGSNMIVRPPLSIENLTNVYSNVSSPIIQGEKDNVQSLSNKPNNNEGSNIKGNSMKNMHIMSPNTPISQPTNQRIQHNTNINPQLQLPALPFSNELVNSTSNLQQFPVERRWQENNFSEVVSLEEPITRSVNFNHVVTSLFDNNNNSHNSNSNSNSNNASVQTEVSPYSTIANFDNWDSEMVWKDVDILMNEFAFNPIV